MASRAIGPERVASVALGILLCSLAPPSTAHAAKPPAIVDQAWVDPGLSSRKLHVVAILPAVTLDGDRRTSMGIARQCWQRFVNTGYLWMPATDSRLLLGATEAQRDSLIAAMEKDVRDQGRPRPETARLIAHRLDADAMLTVRVDRWERVQGSSPMTYVDLVAALVDADGAPLWRLAGRCRLSDATRPSRVDMPRQEPIDQPAPLADVARASTTGSGSSGGTGSGAGAGGSGGRGGGSGGPGGGSSGGGGGSSSTSEPIQATPKLPSDRMGVEKLERYAALRTSGDSDPGTDFAAAVDQLLAAWTARLPQQPRAGDARR